MIEYRKRRKEAYSLASLKTALQNTATPSKIFQNSLVDSVISQGSGLHNVYKALTVPSKVTPSIICKLFYFQTASLISIIINHA